MLKSAESGATEEREAMADARGGGGGSDEASHAREF